MDNHVSFGNIVFGLASAQHSTGFVGCARMEDGTYRVVLTGDSDIKVEVGVASGIESVKTSDQNADNVYTMDGVLVLKNASRSQIDGLAKGMYIINGKKVIR